MSLLFGISTVTPFALTPAKMYATWGDSADWHNFVHDLAQREGKRTLSDVVNGNPLVVVQNPRIPPPSPLRRWVPEVAWPAFRKARGVVARVGGRLRG